MKVKFKTIMRNKLLLIFVILLLIFFNTTMIFCVENAENTDDLYEQKSKIDNKAINITIGGGIIPVNFNTLLSKEISIDMYYTYFKPQILLFSFGLSIPFSFSYYFNNSNAIGFIIEPGYLLSPYTLSTVFWHDFILNMGLRYKYGSFNKNTKLLFEASLLSDFLLVSHNYYYKEKEEDKYNYISTSFFLFILDRNYLLD